MKNTNRQKLSPLALVFTALIALSQTRCGGGTGAGNPEVASEDSSVSGTAAGAVGGALANSSTTGTLTFDEPSVKSHFWAKADWGLLSTANASSLCPTYKTAQGSGCTASSDTLWLTYSDCTFSAGVATWNGTQALIGSSGSASCGTFPSVSANGDLSRQYVTGANSTTAGDVTITSAYGTTATIDDATTNLGNFDGDTISTFINSGYGAKVGYASGLRTSVELGHHLSTPALDHSIAGTLSISDSGTGTRTVSGNLLVYHNLLKVVGTATFTDVVHKDYCCFPVSGTISTLFSAGTNVSPTAAGSAYLGRTETLSFTGCGTADFQAYDGTTSSVVLTRCF